MAQSEPTSALGNSLIKFNGATTCENLYVSSGCVNIVNCEESDVGDKRAGERDRDGDMDADSSDGHGDGDGDCSPVSRTVVGNKFICSCISSSMIKGARGRHQNGEGDGSCSWLILKSFSIVDNDNEIVMPIQI